MNLTCYTVITSTTQTDNNKNKPRCVCIDVWKPVWLTDSGWIMKACGRMEEVVSKTDRINTSNEIQILQCTFFALKRCIRVFKSQTFCCRKQKNIRALLQWKKQNTYGSFGEVQQAVNTVLTFYYLLCLQTVASSTSGRLRATWSFTWSVVCVHLLCHLLLCFWSPAVPVRSYLTLQLLNDPPWPHDF